ncbi:Phylloquinone omega-hydroxylase [Seminavis robusta]|uniref:Phylloquinone omega-hydroxylase n=1 Tax=Seminavis robusta TaxID=568900 RepID=A0A9N8DQU6_9STRA|nr:Phylloquinone omega-hydroxylase [Seminavis robusta]|eukprot:Sro216_g089510.1 Phylloquinone omega-hydroxylase (561) ;mRNA; f:74274-76061
MAFSFSDEALGVPTLAIVLLPIGLYMLWNHYRTLLEAKKPFPDLPMPPQSHWFFGHVKMLFDANKFPQNLYTVNRDSANKDGLVGYWFGNKKVIGVLKVEDARKVFLRESNRETIPVVARYISFILGEKSLIRLNGREWRIHRDAIARTFVPSFLLHSQKDVFQVAQDLTQAIIKRIDETENKVWQVDNIHPLMKMVTMDVIGKAGFGVDFDCCKNLQSSPVVKAFDLLTEDLTIRMKSPVLPWNLFPNIFPTKQNKLHLENCGILRGFVGELLTKAQKEYIANENGEAASTNGNSKHQNLVERLTAVHEINKAKGHDDAKALDDALSDVMMTLLFASYDTTSTTLTMVLHSLSIYPDIQNNCLEEVQSLLKNGSDLSNADELCYCMGVIKEALRLYPAAFTVARTLTKPLQLASGYVAQVGTHMNVPIFVMQRDESIFPKGDEFHPERWAQRVSSTSSSSANNGQLWEERAYKVDAEPSKGSIPAGNPDAFFAFSAGGRSCPGAKFALQEAVIVLANVLKHLKVLPVPDFKLELRLQGILPYPKDGVPLRIEKRQSLDM